VAQNAQDKAPSWDFRLLASADHGIVGEDNLFFDAEVTQGDERDYRYHYTWVNDADPTEIGDDTERERSTFGFIAPHVGDFTLTCVVRRVSDDQTVTKTAPMHFTDGSELRRTYVYDPNEESVIKVDDVSMVFNIASEQFNSLKEYFIALMRHELKFKEFRALDHINFEVKRGEAFGLVGTNGSGKSTMLKIIAGVLEASEGKCTVNGTIAPLIELGAGFDMELTAKENIYLNGALLGYRKDFIDEHFQDIVDFAELQDFMEMPLKNYSSGMVARIAFSIATITEPDILIVDEALSVGDFLFQQKCARRIRQLVESNHVTVLLVSHDINLVERMCDRVCWIEKGHQRMLGPTAEVCAAYKGLGE
jgi:ABC-2 type transport system ATP-binding protein